MRRLEDNIMIYTKKNIAMVTKNRSLYILWFIPPIFLHLRIDLEVTIKTGKLGYHYKPYQILVVWQCFNCSAVFLNRRFIVMLGLKHRHVNNIKQYKNF